VTQPPVDIHAHAVPAGLLADLAAGRIRFPHVELRQTDGGPVMRFNDSPPTRPISAGLTDAARRSAWLAEQGIARQVVSGWLDVFGYELPADEGADWAIALTDAIAEMTAADDRLTPLGTVPLQDPGRSASLLHERYRTNLPGVMISTRAAGRELDDPALTPFWEAAAEAGAVVYLHPGSGASARYADFGLVNGLARLEDSTVTLARLLYAGVPARYPGMKLVVAHGGGALPYVLGRLIRNHLITPGTADPVESFGCLYFDSVVFDAGALEFLVAKAGPGRVLLGSDYPFPIGDPAPRTVLEHASLPGADRDLILGGNAARLFGPATTASTVPSASTLQAPTVPAAGKGTR
jgi:aminocarboxymuconate-semialdehyde decarboxylase